MNHFWDSGDQHWIRSPNKQCELSWGLIKCLDCWVSLPDEAQCSPTSFMVTCHRKQLPLAAARGAGCLLPFPTNFCIPATLGTQANAEEEGGESTVGLANVRGRRESIIGKPGPQQRLGEDLSNSCHCWHRLHHTQRAPGLPWKRGGDATQVHFRISRERYCIAEKGTEAPRLSVTSSLRKETQTQVFNFLPNIEHKSNTCLWQDFFQTLQKRLKQKKVLKKFPGWINPQG